jgi:hypothetical protein
MAHNKEEITAERLFALLESLSKFIDMKMKIYALGGTALTILHMKKSTLDIDLNIATKKEYEYLCHIFEQIGFTRTGDIRWMSQEGLAFDLFHGSNIMGTQLLPDCLEKSTSIKSFGSIDLFTLSLQDTIISKLARGDSRDFDDIKSIFKKEQIDLQGLVKRYEETMENSIVSHYQQKLLDLIEIKFGEWKFPLDKKLIAEVKKWR